MDNVRDDSAKRRHQKFWNFFRPICTFVMRVLYGYSAPKTEVPDGAYLIICNHTTNIDPIFLGCGFKRNMYFVAGDNVFRMGFFSKILNYVFAPICRVKGTTDAASAMTIMRTLKGGSNVAMFAEGNCSFNGSSLPILPATGKLVRSSGAGLITYKIDGGYMTHPRWAASMRHGKMFGRAVKIYSPEEIKAMTPAAINEAISRDIAYNDYDYQRTAKIPYRSRKRAENLEVALYICPKCGGRDTLHSKNAKFWCDCGYSTKVDVYGSFTDGVFADPGEWDEWQNGEIANIAENAGDELIYSDKNVELSRRDRADEPEILGRGEMKLYRDRFEVMGEVFPIEKISSMAMELRKMLVFDCGGTKYLITAMELIGLRKYLQMFELLKNRQ